MNQPEWMDAELVVQDPYNLDQVRERFVEYDEIIDTMGADASQIEVKDDLSIKVAVEMAGQTKQIYKQIEDNRKEIVKEPNKYVKAVNSFAKTFKEPLENIETELKTKIRRYQIEQDRKSREAGIKARKEAEAEQKRLVVEARKKAETEKKTEDEIEDAVAEVEIVTVAPVVSKVTRTETGSASLRKNWAWKEIDFEKIPDEYKTIDTIKINKAVRAGMRNIPGIEIFEEFKTVIR